MKVCPQCNAHYDDSMFFCLEDGTALRTPTDVNLEQTLALPKAEKLRSVQSSSEETLFLPAEQGTGQSPAETESWQSPTIPPNHVPQINTDQHSVKTNLINDAGTKETTRINTNDSGKSGNKATFIVLGGLIGTLVLVSSGYIGWLLSRPRTNDVVVNNINTPLANFNLTPTPSNHNTQSEVNKDVLNENTSETSNFNVVPSPVTNQSTPKTSPTKDKSPTPTPNETVTPTPTPIIKTPTPTPIPTRTPDKTTPDVISGGVLNKRADILFQPKYPPAAKANGIGGIVNVQVLVDENGRVVRASAVSGPAILRASAEVAARSTKFPPMTSGGQPVKVTGIIVFKFNP